MRTALLVFLIYISITICTTYGYEGERHERSDGEKDGYGNSYEDDGCHGDCPSLQSADSVSNAYIKHYSFVWATLAEEVAGKRKTGRQAAEGDSMPHRARPTTRDLRKQHRANRPAGQTTPKPANHAVPKPAAPVQQPTTAPVSKPVPEHDAAWKQVEQSKNNTAGAGSGNSSSTAAHTAAVTDPDCLLPTARESSGEGFQGTSDIVVPSDEALAVGPHPGDPDAVLVLHGINRAIEIFAATRDGAKIESQVPTKIHTWEIMQRMGYNSDPSTNLRSSGIQAFYDMKDKRYVVTWSSVIRNQDESALDGNPPVFVCVSEDVNPLGTWTCWALDAVPEAQPFTPLCAGLPNWSFSPDYPQLSYSDDAVFMSLGAYCDAPDGSLAGFVSVLYAFPKKVLYSTPEASSTDLQVWRATYLPSSSWFRSLPIEDQMVEYDSENPVSNAFNSFFLPSRPHSIKDVSDPFFVMGKVDGNHYMSIAKLTKEPFDLMESRTTAPKIYAAVLSKKADFSNTPGDTGVIPQPGGTDLDAGDVGWGGKTYGAMHHDGLVYLATSELFGDKTARLPALYWAIVDPSPKLCKPSVVDWGVVASEQGLALAYPVIAAREDCGAFLAFAYGGNTNIMLNGNSYPAYAGSASTVVGCHGRQEPIEIIKRGEGIISRFANNPQRWGGYSAISVLEGKAWVAVPFAMESQPQYGSWISTERL